MIAKFCALKVCLSEQIPCSHYFRSDTAFQHFLFTTQQFYSKSANLLKILFKGCQIFQHFISQFSTFFRIFHAVSRWQYITSFIHSILNFRLSLILFIFSIFSFGCIYRRTKTFMQRRRKTSLFFGRSNYRV